MLRNLMITALILSAGTAHAEFKLVFELNEATIVASDIFDTPPLIYLTQNDKSLTLQLDCKKSPTLTIFEKIPLIALSIPSPDDLLGEAKMKRTDCEKIVKCVLSKSISTNAFITVSVDSETEAFTLDSLGENCKEAPTL